MKKIFLFLIISCVVITELCSQNNYCKTTGNFPDALQGKQSGTGFQKSYPLIIRIFIHAVRNSAGTNGVTTYQINQALNILAADFSSQSICFSLVGSDNIYSDAFMNYTGDVTLQQQIITTNSTTNAIDVYAFPDDKVNFGLAAGGIPGKSLIIGGGAQFQNEPNAILFTSHVFSHEIGHCLGLYHTFEKSFCEEYVNGDANNRSNCGDKVSDTPASPIYFNDPINSNCQWTNPRNLVDGQNTQYPSTNATNRMSYSYPRCMYDITDGQTTRMKDVLFYSSVLQPLLVPNNVYVQNKQYNNSNLLLFAAQISVTAGYNVTSGAVGNVLLSNLNRGEFRAGNFIDLKPGFNSQPINGGVFLTTIQPVCNTVVQNNSALVSLANAYIPLLKNSEWIMTSKGFEGNINSRVKSMSDTVVNGQIYQKLVGKIIKLSSLYSDPSITTTDNPYFLGEDLENKTVFKLLSDGTKKVMYDFKLNYGQSCPENSKFYVSNIDSVTITGGRRSRITFSDSLSNKIIWIEGVGNISNPFVSSAILQSNQTLICSYKNGILDFDEGKTFNLDCNAINSVTGIQSDNIKSEDISIYPNPSSGQFNISSFVSFKTNIQIIDVLGRIVKIIKNIDLNKEPTIDLSELQSGSYFLKFETQNSFIVKKIQKQ